MQHPVGNTPSKLQRPHGVWRMAALTAVLACGASLSQVALADGAGPRGMGGPGQHGGMQGHGPRGAGEHMGHMQHMLDAVKASPEQRAQIKKIAEDAHTAMAGQREARRALHQEQMALFSQASIDANAAEALRQRSLALHDQASKRRMQMQLDISRVLSADQRQMAAQRMQQHQQMRQRHQAEREAMRK